MTSTYETELEADKAGHVTFTGTAEYPVDKLNGMRVVVTGGASGIGEACCRRLAAAGAHVVIADKNERLGEALGKELGGEGRVRYVSVDAASWDSQLAMFAEALEFLPGHELDALVTSAGIGSSVDLNVVPPALNTVPLGTLAEREKIPRPSTACMDVNLIGTMFSVNIATTYGMGSVDRSNAPTTGRGNKSIVLLGSTSGFRPLPGKIDYSVAKWGVRGFFRNIRSELPQYGIRVNMMAPFWVPTTLTERHVPALERQGVRVGRMSDVIDGILRMILDSRMNGRAISVTGKGIEDIDDDLAGQDGGTTMRALVQDGWLSAPKSATGQH